MRFKTLRIRNFLSVGEEQTVDLDRAGLVVVTGDNKDSSGADSNGSGKSSIFMDSILWCLWGKTLRNLKADEVVNRKAKKNCLVELTIIDDLSKDQTEYRVCRTRKDKTSKKPSDLQLYVDGQPVTAGINKDTQSLIDGIVGMDAPTFTQSVLLSSGERSFCEMTDAEQKRVLDDILQLDVIQRARDVTKKKIHDQENQLVGLMSNMTTVEKDLIAIEGRYKTLREEADKFKEKQRQKMLRELINKTQKEIEAEALAAQYDLVQVAEGLEEKKKILVELDEIEGSINKKYREFHDANVEEQTSLASKWTLLESKRKDLEEAITNVNHLAGKECPTCRQQVTPDFADSNLEIWQEKKEKMDEVGAKIKAALSDLQYRARQFNEEMDKESEELGKKRRLAQDTIQIEISKVSKAEASLHLLFSAADFARVHGENAELVRQEPNPYQDLLKDVEAQKNYLNQKARSIEFQIKAKEIELTHLRFWANGFGNQGIKSFMLDSIIPFLTKRAQRYADILSDGDLKIEFSTQTTLKKGTTKDSFQVKVQNSQGADIYAGNSSGEKRRSDIAVGWALGDLAATRAKKPIRFKGLDEPFESLDESGEDAVIKLLHEVLPEYETIFCITHSSHLKNQFPNEVVVVKENGQSKIKV